MEEDNVPIPFLDAACVYYRNIESMERILGRPGRDAVSGNCSAMMVKGFFVRRGWMKEKQRALRT